MRFSIAIDRIVSREPEPAPLDEVPRQLDGALPAPASLVVPPPPPDLDQRVRLSGEW